jgi:N-acyl-D-aspartate/D-glutamate deacylase
VTRSPGPIPAQTRLALAASLQMSVVSATNISAPRVLGRYVRERGALTLESAVAKLTSVPAARLDLPHRGVVREGSFADLVVFDPATVADRATYERPAVHPAGIDAVIVNGVVAVRDGVESGLRPGRLLRRA